MQSIIIALLLLVLTVNPVNSHELCDRAPTVATRIICKQLYQWDKHVQRMTAMKAREEPPPSSNAYECMDIACLCRFFGGTGGSNCVLTNGARLEKIIRKEYRVMTDEERNRYHKAMWILKTNGEYDEFSKIHSSYLFSPGAHSGPAFLPWHREFVKRMEIALRRVDPDVAVPYWDSVLDSSLANPTESSLFTDELMGRQSPDGTVLTGAFGGFRIDDNSRVFRRNLGGVGNLFRKSDIDTVMATSDFRQVLAFTNPSQSCPFSPVWTSLEYAHGGPHVYVGGDMYYIPTSTYDPIFWNHHSFVDLIWESWRVTHQSRTDREIQYPQDNPLCSTPSHFAHNTMHPFLSMRNVHGLSNAYTDNLYGYAPRPTCSAANREGCGSRFLFCDLSHGAPRCAAKIAVNGNCRGYFHNEDMCYWSVCQGNICIKVPQPPIFPTTPNPSEENCFNMDECCAPWAKRGECAYNPLYMKVNCKASCGICRPTTYDINIECSNRHIMCNYWASNGDCVKNSKWMAENCRQSCGKCGFTREQVCTVQGTTTAPSTESPSEGGTCLNQHYCCIAWADNGHCSSTPQYMVQYCQPSCHLCKGSSPPPLWNSYPCVDFSPYCSLWAQQGNCEYKSNYMWENCKLSCRKCSLLTMSERLSACGFKHRLLKTGRRISEFRISPLSLTLKKQSAPVSLAPPMPKPLPKMMSSPRKREEEKEQEKIQKKSTGKTVTVH